MTNIARAKKPNLDEKLQFISLNLKYQFYSKFRTVSFPNFDRFLNIFYSNFLRTANFSLLLM